MSENDSGFFPSIEQFRHVVRAERETAAFHGREPAVREYVGTIKLHGTNAGITRQADGSIIFRSRSRIITPEDDNAGFAKWMTAHIDEVRSIFVPFHSGAEVTVFGEWCGQGIQNNVGISALQKMFVIFALLLDDGWHDVQLIPSNQGARIFNVFDYPFWVRTIDFSKPEAIQNELVALTEAVEAECPVAKAFGHSGIGEGIVWTPMTGDRSSRYWFKVKGEKHSSSKVKVLAAVDVERFAKRDELVTAICTEARLQQGIDLHVGEFGRALEMKAIGEYLRWVFNDVIKEEADTIAASGFEQKELGKPISDIAKRFYIKAVEAA